MKKTRNVIIRDSMVDFTRESSELFSESLGIEDSVLEAFHTDIKDTLFEDNYLEKNGIDKRSDLTKFLYTNFSKIEISIIAERMMTQDQKIEINIGKPAPSEPTQSLISELLKGVKKIR